VEKKNGVEKKMGWEKGEGKSRGWNLSPISILGLGDRSL